MTEEINKSKKTREGIEYNKIPMTFRKGVPLEAPPLGNQLQTTIECVCIGRPKEKEEGRIKCKSKISLSVDWHWRPKPLTKLMMLAEAFDLGQNANINAVERLHNSELVEDREDDHWRSGVPKREPLPPWDKEMKEMRDLFYKKNWRRVNNTLDTKDRHRYWVCPDCATFMIEKSKEYKASLSSNKWELCSR